MRLSNVPNRPAILLAALVLALAACTPAEELIVPREQTDLSLVKLDPAAFSLDGDKIAITTLAPRPQEAEIDTDADLGRIIIDTIPAIPLVSMEMKVVTTRHFEGANVKDFFFRFEDVPADDEFFSVSVDPASPDETRASLFTFYQTRTTGETEVIPGSTSGTLENCRVRLRQDGPGLISGSLVFVTDSIGTFTTTVEADFRIEYTTN